MSRQRDEQSERKDAFIAILKQAYNLISIVPGMEMRCEMKTNDEETVLEITYLFPDKIENERIYSAMGQALREFGETVPEEHRIDEWNTDAE